MLEMSATVTVGEGSEKHNHSIGYRSQELKHTHDTSKETVIELVPYEKTYKEKINELMKPYIEKYNKRVEERWQEAWERFNNGDRKSKPKRKNYPHLGFDYYSDHIKDERKNKKTGKVERLPLYRSLILGIGDEQDKEKISLEQAKGLFEAVIDQFKIDFPDFKILGATLHADEFGFWHVHLDFFVMYEKVGDHIGLDVGTGLENALKNMGYKPEQSIINGRDKVPLLFNAMRNKIYANMEQAMKKEGIYLQYGVSKLKDPKKDSSKNQALEDWQATQDKVREMQHQKNKLMDALQVGEGKVKNQDIKQAIQSYNALESTLNELQSVKKSRWDKNKGLIEFSLLDQLKSLVERLKETLRKCIETINGLVKENQELRKENISIKNRLDIYLQKEKDGLVFTKDQLKARDEIAQRKINDAEGQRDRLWNYLEDKGMPSYQIGELAHEYEKDEMEEMIKK